MNNKWCTFKLAECYENGIGVVKNLDLAINFYRQAATLGHKDANAKLLALSQ